MTALVFGSTGLTGKHLLDELLRSADYSNVYAFVRKASGINHPKLKEYTVDFNVPESFRELIKGDVIFCCTGTTIRKAGSKESFRKVDYDIPVNMARIASGNGVSKFIVISSIGANSKSSNFYLHTKGEMEEAVSKYSFKQISIVRPSMLTGPREEFRLGEMAGKAVMLIANIFLIGKLKKYRSIHAGTVARAMIKLAKGNQNKIIFNSDELSEMGK